MLPVVGDEVVIVSRWLALFLGRCAEPAVIDKLDGFLVVPEAVPTPIGSSFAFAPVLPLGVSPVGVARVNLQRRGQAQPQRRRQIFHTQVPGILSSFFSVSNYSRGLAVPKEVLWRLGFVPAVGTARVISVA